MDVKTHYEKHLAHFYSWMAGDFEQKEAEFRRFLVQQSLSPAHRRVALDLGAGHGIQSVALAKLGFSVTAVDFNQHLLGELQANAGNLPIEVHQDDIRNVNDYTDRQPELILCCGDTLTHLPDKAELTTFLEDCQATLIPAGKLLLSFRDYSSELSDEQRFIPVKSDDHRILTCVLDYEPEGVKVTDLLYEKDAAGWSSKVSSYYKVRVAPREVTQVLEQRGMQVLFHESAQGMHTIIAKK